jgi:ribose 5-phosphate isomerase RpiB
MTTGPGKYDDVATMVREKTEAACVVVIVIDGNHGNGFSVQATNLGGMFAAVPIALRMAADQIEEDARRLKR